MFPHARHLGVDRLDELSAAMTRPASNAGGVPGLTRLRVRVKTAVLRRLWASATASS